ncbi:MAG: hypothetical protein ACXVAX_12800 [Pseudobdellovibrio sp.]
MFKYSSRSLLTGFFVFLFFSIKGYAVYDQNRTGVVTKQVDEQDILAESSQPDWNVGETVAVVSQNSKLGAIAFVEVEQVTDKPEGTYEIKLRLQRQSRKYLIQVGDFIRKMDLSTSNTDYLGTTDLLIRENQINISAKYRPLVYQGLVIGDTAQTLYEKEFLVNYFGNLYYGATANLTLGTLAPVNVLGRPNFNMRYKVYDSEATTLSTGLSFVRLYKEGQAALNLNLYWDNTSSDALISHTFLGLGVIRWDNSGDAAALKYLTSSSFQTGYEVLLDNWDRFLVGPSYNFDKKALGGYLSYIWIADRLHLQFSLNATDITHLRLDPTDGYYAFFDMFWRF